MLTVEKQWFMGGKIQNRSIGTRASLEDRDGDHKDCLLHDSRCGDQTDSIPFLTPLWTGGCVHAML